jgi:hypothetical protein
MTRHDDPESKSAGKKPPLAAVTLGLDQRNSCVLPKRTPWAGAMYLQKCYNFELGDKVLHICIGGSAGVRTELASRWGTPPSCQ